MRSYTFIEYVQLKGAPIMRFSEFKSMTKTKDATWCTSPDVLHSYLPNRAKEPNVGEYPYGIPNHRQPMVVEDSRSKLWDDGYWRVQPIGYSWNRISVFIVCPHCKNIHIHGNSNGHRGTHCDPHVNRNNGYYIEGADGIYEMPRSYSRTATS